MLNGSDFALETTIYAKFTTTAAATGAPTQLAGSPVVSVYENDDNTQITAGITLTVDEDGITGLNQLAIAATAANGYEAGKFYDAVITTGTVGGTSAVGYVVATFSIQAQSALRPTTAGRTLDVASTGEAGIDVGNILLPVGAIPALGIIDNGTLQSATATTAVLRAAASFADDRLNGMTLQITGGTGVGQARVITDYVNATDTATVDAWVTTPDGTSTYVVFGTPPAPSTTVTNITGNLSGSVGSVTGAVGSVAAGGIAAASFAAGAIDAAALAASAGTELAAAVLAAAAADPIDANIEQINTVTVIGDGTAGNKWRA